MEAAPRRRILSSRPTGRIVLIRDGALLKRRRPAPAVRVMPLRA